MNTTLLKLLHESKECSIRDVAYMVQYPAPQLGKDH